MKEKNIDCFFDLVCNLRSTYEYIKEEFLFWYFKDNKKKR